MYTLFNHSFNQRNIYSYTVLNTGEIAMKFVSSVVALGKGYCDVYKKKSIFTLFAGKLLNEVTDVYSSQGLLSNRVASYRGN